MTTFTVTIDTSRIPATDLDIALRNAALDPDGQVFPWMPAYPLVGSTVYHDGQLWTVVHRERGPWPETDIDVVKLQGQGRDAAAVTTRGELRPITWTQADEDGLDLA
ncbi:MAG TPA: hypothetical protein VI172_16065 [Candidatus Dormibacteraeota bacterium]|jgi:hypothetical protein